MPSSPPMYMEDLIEELATHRRSLTRADEKFICSVARRTEQGKALTSRQAWVAIKIFRDNGYYSILKMDPKTYRETIRAPRWRRPLIESAFVASEVRYMGDNYLAFRTSKSSLARPHFDLLRAQYFYGLMVACIDTPQKLDAAIKAIGEIGFKLDSETELWLADALSCISLQPSALASETNLIIDVPNDTPLAEWSKHVLGAKPV